MGRQQDSEAGSMAGYPYIMRPPEHEQLQQSPDDAAQLAYMDFRRGKVNPKPLEHHGKSYLKQHSDTTLPDTMEYGYGSNVSGSPLPTTDKTIDAAWNGMDQRSDIPLISGEGNKATIYNYYYVPPYPYYMPSDQRGRFNHSKMVHGNSALGQITSGSRSIKDDVAPPHIHGGSTAANSYVKYPKQYGETAYAYAMPPKQQTLEFHLKEPVMVDGEVPRDGARRRHTYLKNFRKVTGYSGKLTPAEAKMQPYKSSTGVSPGHHGSVVGAFLLSNKLCDSESEDSD